MSKQITFASRPYGLSVTGTFPSPTTNTP